MAAGKASPPPFPARNAAWQTIDLCLQGNRPIQEALDTVLNRTSLDPRDEALAAEISYGYLRYKGRIDFLLHLYLRAPEHLPAPLLQLLGLAAYELLFLRIPAYATVHSAVDMVRARFSPGLAKLSNAVLRRISQLGADAGNPDFFLAKAKNAQQADAAFYSLPVWLHVLLRDHCGFQEPRLFLDSLLPPPLGLRVNTVHPDQEELLTRLENAPGLLDRLGPMFCLEGNPLSDLTACLAQGRVSRQGFGVYEALVAMEPNTWPSPLWEACCGRGGKTCALLENGMPPFWASDLSLGRLIGLNHDIRRLGLPRPVVFLAAADKPAPLARKPQTIFLDVPCSGLGVLARRPDIKWKLNPSRIQEFIARQASLAQAALSLLPAGGILIYMTCTLHDAENRTQVEHMSKAHGARIEQTWQTPTSSKGREHLYCARLIKT